MSEPIVQIVQARKRYGDVAAVDNVSLDIARGEFVALLGPSGCGKTSLMRLIAGFETPDSGDIFINGENMQGVPPHRRPVNMMFQSYALFPHMNVARNIGFGLKQAGASRSEIDERVASLLKLVRLENLGGRMPGQLSGGQKQRVALARALAPRPALLLLDEPLGALDRKLREETQFELMALQRELNLSFLTVTHDQDEAMAMAQRIALMRAGRIEQIGNARQIYEEPVSRFAAEFIGEVNLFEGRLEADAAGVSFITPDAGGFSARLPAASTTHGAALLALRPGRLRLSPESGKPDAANEVCIPGAVTDFAYRGSAMTWRIDAGGKVLRVAGSSTNAQQFQRGDQVLLSFDPAHARILPP